MSSFYLRLYQRAPEFLKRRVNPLDYAIQDLVREASGLPDGTWVLDAGAGEARFRPLFSRQRYLALDSAVGDADWDYSRLHVRGDLARLPLAGEVFDAVLCIQVLEHVPDPASVLRETFRVLKPGGRLFLSAPQGWPEHQQPTDYYRFTRFALEALLEQAGFEQIRVLPMGGYFHYLGNRFTFAPKILFAGRKGWKRLALLPLELPVLALAGGLLPVLCYYLDRWDTRKEFTLGYGCRARKPAPSPGAAEPF